VGVSSPEMEGWSLFGSGVRRGKGRGLGKRRVGRIDGSVGR
jgi:hypothetical protein